VKILAISGSLNGASSNTALLRVICDAVSFPDEVALFDSLDDIPHFSPDREREVAPPAVASLRDALCDADAVLIATPEYAGGMPGALKNALDWLVGSGELYAKRAVVVSAAPSLERGRHARESLERTLRMQGAPVCESFTVAVPHGQSAAAFAETADDVLMRTLHALVTGPADDTLAQETSETH
jgi:NAD(P)H-dependent FMN reductase